MNTEQFALRHIGIREQDLEHMYQTIGVESLEQLINETIPEDIRLKNPLKLDAPISESDFLNHLQALSRKNKVFKSYIGMGYHESVTPSVIKRNILENPGWYTAYTPYQAEIAQGRLEALLNFQTVISDLTGMELANASLLDESTAAAEAMTMLFDLRSRDQKKRQVNKFFVSEAVLPQTLSLLQTRSKPLGIVLVIGDHADFDFDTEFFGALLQYPGKYGQVFDFGSFIQNAHENDIKVAVAADILSLILLTPPGELGADVVVGTTQRMGIPLGYGGPHAAFFASREAYKRHIPGRIIGVTRDMANQSALRMALQTREQHIKRDKATSNICTAQVLLAVMAGAYAVYHGPDGLRFIANEIHRKTRVLNDYLSASGIEQANTSFFDTLKLRPESVADIKIRAEKQGINLNYIDEHWVSVSINEATTETDLSRLAACLSGSTEAVDLSAYKQVDEPIFPNGLSRSTSFLEHEVFNSYHSETELMRYLKKLERKDLALNHSMIALGSCTMKLNAATEMLPLSTPEWGNIHPFVPVEQAAGYHEVLRKLEEDLTTITGFAATSLQPNSGAQGEYSGLMTIRA
ncbi:MAG: glycine dehydrogenase (aminomethyl-transferring), partial [Flavobacteriaceae bacterium]|nr:glycine dehydrogenase (aminomethyl-transferring) [Eudoraea sp.]NNJ37770.1 glycine dehydrogenase (aminomethyl-transferring) [Flavobacteriaceae bacterium]